MTNLKRLAIIAVFAILATACSTPQPIKGKGTHPSTNNSSATINNLLLQAKSETFLKAAQLQLQAAKLMLVQQNYSRASTLLNAIDVKALPLNLQFKIALVKAESYVGLSNGISAINTLSVFDDNRDHSNAQQYQKHLILANAYGLTNQLSKEVTALISASGFTFASTQLFALNEKIWQVFKTLDLTELTALKSQSSSSYNLRGWLALMVEFKETPNSEKTVASLWFKRWGSHLAAKYQPQELAQYLLREPLHNNSYQYTHVAVALPVSGKYAKGANAILTGIKLAANQGHNRQIQISYIDSSTHNTAQAILDRALQINADALIGPLDRALVAQFAQIAELPLPVLALNSSPISNSNLYQFALSDDDEVRDAAQKAFNDGRRNVLILVPDSEKGIFAANTFSNEFNSLGGQIASTTFYDTSKGNVTNAVAKMLKLNQGHIRGLQKKLKTAHLRKAIRRMTRKDADAIFLFSSASDAYQIGPSILYFYADNLPLYSTSKIYSGKSNPVKNIDLNGRMFGDLPWVLSPSSNKGSIASQTSKANTRFGRLYAFGIDALNIAPNLYTLANQPNSSIEGETGKLSVSSENIVQKSLTWAKFINGEAVLVPAQ